MGFTQVRCGRVLERIVNQNNFSDIALGQLILEDTISLMFDMI